MRFIISFFFGFDLFLFIEILLPSNTEQLRDVEWRKLISLRSHSIIMFDTHLLIKNNQNAASYIYPPIIPCQGFCILIVLNLHWIMSRIFLRRQKKHRHKITKHPIETPHTLTYRSECMSSQMRCQHTTNTSSDQSNLSHIFAIFYLSLSYLTP